MENINEEIEKLKQLREQRRDNSISKLTAEDKADINDAHKAKKEYLQTEISYTVDELRAEFNLTSR
jgi:cellobiose-specific phosphotransferase system component IIA